MKLIAWWLVLTCILPLFYLFWWKKNWRLQLGVAMLLILAIGIFVPGEIVHSMLRSKLDKEVEKPWTKLKEALKNTPTDAKPTASKNEKLWLEKSINEAWKELNNIRVKEIIKREELSKEEINKREQIKRRLSMLQWRWIRKFGGEKEPPIFLFCGKEFNQELGRDFWEIESSNIIDFGEQKDISSLKKKLQEIYENNYYALFCLIWLKNIDKITDSSLKNELLKIIDHSKNTDLGKYQQTRKVRGETQRAEITIDFSQFILFATTSNSNPQLSSEIKHKLKNAYPNLLKYNWITFFISGGLEIVVFLLLIRAKKKSDIKTFEHSKH